MEINETVKAALITFGLKDGATLTEVRAEYLDVTSESKFMRVLSDDEELADQFTRYYKAYATLIKHYASEGGREDLSLYPADQLFLFHFNTGVYFFLNQQFLKAGEKFQEAYKVNPKHCTLLVYLGILLLKRKNYYAAEKYFKDAALVDKNSDDAWFYLGESYLKAGQHRKAYSMFETAKTLNPGRTEIAFRLKELKEQGHTPPRKYTGVSAGKDSKESFVSRLINKLIGR